MTDRLAAERSAQGLPPEHIEDPGVLARVAALVHAAICNTSPYATNGRPRQAAAVITDPGGTDSDGCPSS
jgi:hypothetical protein